MFSIPCVIFAGGKSLRMGKDKALLPFGGYPTLTQFQYERLKLLFSDVYISTKSASKFDFKAHIIEDSSSIDIFAPTAGFISSLKTLNRDRIFVLSVDTPFIDKAEISKLMYADSSEVDAVISKTPLGIHPMCGIYHYSLLDKFEKMLQSNEHKLGMLLKSSNTHFVSFKDEEKFANLNHPHEYQEALLRV